MARDGSGGYSLPEAAFVFNTIIDEGAVNNNFSDIADALTASIAKDGQTNPTANLPMATFRHTGVGNAVARTDYAAAGQVQDSVLQWAGTATGTANAITLTVTPSLTAYAAGQRFAFIAASTNTGATTVTVSGLTAKNIFWREYALNGGEILSGYLYEIIYNGTEFEIIGNPPLEARENLLINSDFYIAQRGTSYTSGTSPANNDDTYTLDRWILLSDGNDIVDVSQETTIVPDGARASVKMDTETANKKYGLIQILPFHESARARGQAVSLSLKLREDGSASTLNTIRAGVLSWAGTADSVTSDVVSAWAAEGTNPTLATNWSFLNTATDLDMTDDTWVTFKIDDIDVPTSCNNLAVFIWTDDADATVGDIWYLGDVKLEIGAQATPYRAKPYRDELEAAQMFYRVEGIGASVFAFSTTAADIGITFSSPMRAAPSSVAFAPGVSFVQATISGSGKNSSTSPSALTAGVNGCFFRIGSGFTGIAAGQGGAVTNSAFAFDAEL